MSNGGTLVVRNPASRTRATDGVPTLDESWARAEAALPKGTVISGVAAFDYDRDCGDQWWMDRWEVTTGRHGNEESYESGPRAVGDSPVAALIALAEKLEAR